MFKQAIAVSFLSLVMSLPAHATLIDRGGGMIYDDVLDITWLQDANYAKTSGYDTDGLMNWDAAVAWAAGLSYGGYTNWRLPTMLDTSTAGCNFAYSGTDCGWNVQTYDSGTSTVYSELAYMYYVNLGLKPYYNPNGSGRSDWGIFGNGTCNGTNCSSFGQNDVGLIDNLQASVYWSGLEYALNQDRAWRFIMNHGAQDPPDAKYYEHYAWAVRTGDVPEPSVLALLGIGLLGIGFSRKWIYKIKSV